MKDFLQKWWPLFVWAAIITFSSSTYVSTKGFVLWMSEHSPWTITQQKFSAFWEVWWWVFVKGFHVIEFSILFLLLVSTLRRTKLAPKATITAAYIATIAFSALDEWHQTFVPLRGGRVTDVLIDMSGATVVALLFVVRNARVAPTAVQNGGSE